MTGVGARGVGSARGTVRYIGPRSGRHRNVIGPSSYRIVTVIVAEARLCREEGARAHAGEQESSQPPSPHRPTRGQQAHLEARARGALASAQLSPQLQSSKKSIPTYSTPVAFRSRSKCSTCPFALRVPRARGSLYVGPGRAPRTRASESFGPARCSRPAKSATRRGGVKKCGSSAAAGSY